MTAIRCPSPCQWFLPSRRVLLIRVCRFRWRLAGSWIWIPGDGRLNVDHVQRNISLRGLVADMWAGRHGGLECVATIHTCDNQVECDTLKEKGRKGWWEAQQNQKNKVAYNDLDDLCINHNRGSISFGISVWQIGTSLTESETPYCPLFEAMYKPKRIMMEKVYRSPDSISTTSTRVSGEFTAIDERCWKGFRMFQIRWTMSARVRVRYSWTECKLLDAQVVNTFVARVRHSILVMKGTRDEAFNNLPEVSKVAST